jgi:hypothetical protein
MFRNKRGQTRANRDGLGAIRPLRLSHALVTTLPLPGPPAGARLHFHLPIAPIYSLLMQERIL